MKLLIKSLKMSNFKGVKEFRLMFNNAETKLYGANGTGKTTIADAFFFIYTGEDSQGIQAKEWVQTLDDENSKVHKTDHEAEVIIEVDGDSITLGRKVSEKWVKPRGQKEEVLDEKLDYTYYIDGVSTPAKQFETFIVEKVFGSKFTKDEFVLLSNPTAFCNLAWKEQRDILYKICGTASDEEVIQTDEKFSFLTEALRHKDVETLKKALRKSISDTKDEIKALTAVIKDRKNSLTKEYTRQDVIQEKAVKEEHIKTLQEKLNADSSKMQEIREKQKAILEIENLKNKAEAEYYTRENKEKNNLHIIKNKLESELRQLVNDMEVNAKYLERNRQELDMIANKKKDFRINWDKVKTLQIDENSTICPHCGQVLTEEKLAEVAANFNQNKSEQLAKLKQVAEDIKADEISFSQEIGKYEITIDEQKIKHSQLEEELKKCSESIESLAEIKPFNDKEFIEEIAELQKEIDAFKLKDDTEIKEQINIANKDLQLIAIKLNKCDTYDKDEQEIANKEAEQKEKQYTLADLETQYMNVEDFVVTKVKMLEEKVNSYFENVQFKLFKQNLKGNWEETCVALAKGRNGSLVDIKSGVANTALRVQAGVEIVLALQKHFDYYCPVIIDNRESVTNVPEVQGQMISLIVNEEDKELRCE